MLLWIYRAYPAPCFFIAGIPDIENVIAIAALVDISMDALLSNEKEAKKPTDYLFESITEYDIDEPKRFDMNFGEAKQLVLSGGKSEKIRVRLASNTLSTIQRDFKVKIDDIRKRMDVEVNRRNGVSEATAKEAVVSAAITDGIYETINLSDWNQFDDTGGIALGIGLILMAMIVRYGAELEHRKQS